MDTRNFEKVLKLDGAYSAISKRAETIFGFGGIRAGRSVIMVGRDKDAYNISVFIRNEWGEKYVPLGAYQYRIECGTIFVSETDWDHEEVTTPKYLYFPLYFSEEGKELLTDIVRYLVSK